MSGFGGGLLGGLLQGFGGVMLQKEQRDADDRRARAQQKQEVFQALIKDPNVSMGAKALALQGLIATTGERETRKGTQRTGGAKGPGSADILERIRRMPAEEKPPISVDESQRTMGAVPSRGQPAAGAGPLPAGFSPLPAGSRLEAPGSQGLFKSESALNTEEATRIRSQTRARAGAEAEVSEERIQNEIAQRERDRGRPLSAEERSQLRDALMGLPARKVIREGTGEPLRGEDIGRQAGTYWKQVWYADGSTDYVQVGAPRLSGTAKKVDDIAALIAQQKGVSKEQAQPEAAALFLDQEFQKLTNAKLRADALRQMKRIRERLVGGTMRPVDAKALLGYVRGRARDLTDPNRPDPAYFMKPESEVIADLLGPTGYTEDDLKRIMSGKGTAMPKNGATPKSRTGKTPPVDTGANPDDPFDIGPPIFTPGAPAP